MRNRKIQEKITQWYKGTRNLLGVCITSILTPIQSNIVDSDPLLSIYYCHSTTGLQMQVDRKPRNFLVQNWTAIFFWVFILILGTVKPAATKTCNLFVTLLQNELKSNVRCLHLRSNLSYNKSSCYRKKREVLLFATKFAHFPYFTGRRQTCWTASDVTLPIPCMAWIPRNFSQS